ncbi:ABC transporter C family member 13 [Tanacetum coccineum]
MVMMGNELDAATVFTCLALFNILISLLNSLPSLFTQAVISTRWLSSDLEVKVPILDRVNLAIPKGSLVAVIGEVGSGKSSLLNSVLGEMKLIKGSLYLSESAAYFLRIPWILSGTIQYNVLFGKNYDPIRYSAILEACALVADVSHMVGRDMAYIEEKAIYAAAADMVVIMDKEQVKWVGSLATYVAFVRHCLNFEIVALDLIDIKNGTCLSEEIVGATAGSSTSDALAASLKEKEVYYLMSLCSIYGNYAGFLGWYITVITCLSTLLIQASRNGNDL